MKQLQGILAVTGRVLLCIIFLMAAVGNKIPHFSDVAQVMDSKGIPQPKLMLAGAIVFLLAGSLSVITTKNVWQTIEAENPNLWSELKSSDIDAMIDELVEYKKAHFLDDRRRILTCGGTSRSTVRVLWLPPAAPGVDVKWETQLYGMVLAGFTEEAVRFLQKTRKLSAVEARMMVAKVARDLGMS